MSRAFESLTVGRWQLPQRFVMAPLTRNRAGAGHAPTTLNAEYYAQRASAGLIITEGTQPSASARATCVPGLYTDEQAAGWRPVVEAVHAAGGRSSPRSCTPAASPPRHQGGGDPRPPAPSPRPARWSPPGRQPHPYTARPGPDEIAGPSRTSSPRPATPPPSARRRRDPRRQRLPAARVPLPGDQHARRRVRRRAGGPRPASSSRSSGRSPRPSAPTGRPPISPGPVRRRQREVRSRPERPTRRPVDGSPARPGLPPVLAAAEPDLVHELRERFDGVLSSTAASARHHPRRARGALEPARPPVVVGRPFLANPDLERAGSQGAANEPARHCSTGAAPRATPTTRRSTRRPEPGGPAQDL